MSDVNEYSSHFIRDKKMKGDASVWYLYSKTAPEEIKALVENPKIIICLRNPIDMIFSLHGETIYNGYENESDFEKALALEYSRKAGKNIPSSAIFNQCLYYKENGLYSSHIERWQKAFGTNNVMIVLLDELKLNATETTNKVLHFLGLNALEKLDTEIQNEAKEFGSLTLHQKFKSAKSWEKTIVRILLPSKKIREKLLHKIYNSNIQKAERKNMSAELRNSLVEFFTEDIKATEKIIGKNLQHWLK